MIRSWARRTRRTALVAVSVLAFAALGFLVSALVTFAAASSACTAVPLHAVPTPVPSISGGAVRSPGGFGNSASASAPVAVRVSPSHGSFSFSAAAASSCEVHSLLPLVGTLGGALFGALFALGLMRFGGGSKRYPYLGYSPPPAA